MNKAGVVVVALLSALAGAAGVYFLAPSQAVVAVAPAAAPRAAVLVRVAPVVEADIVRGVDAVGSLRSDESVVLRPEVSGRIRRIAFTEGTEVRRGDVLLELDDATARASRDQIRAQQALTAQQSRRASELLAEGFISKEARDTAASADAAQRAAVALAEANLAKHVIRAPFDGVVGLRQVSVGEYVTSGQDLAPLEALAALKVDFRVPERYVTRLRVGQPLRLRFDALPDVERDGRVLAISPAVDAGGRSVLVRAEAANPDGLLRPGMFARVALVFDSEPALQVPETALVPSGGEQFVFRLDGDVVRRVRVEIGERRAGRVEIVSGLRADDQVVVAGQQRLNDGVPVRVASGDDA